MKKTCTVGGYVEATGGAPGYQCALLLAGNRCGGNVICRYEKGEIAKQAKIEELQRDVRFYTQKLAATEGRIDTEAEIRVCKFHISKARTALRRMGVIA